MTVTQTGSLIACDCLVPGNSYLMMEWRRPETVISEVKYLGFGLDEFNLVSRVPAPSELTPEDKFFFKKNNQVFVASGGPSPSANPVPGSLFLHESNAWCRITLFDPSAPAKKWCRQSTTDWRPAVAEIAASLFYMKTPQQEA